MPNLLTQRQRETLYYRALGRSLGETALAMGISTRTVQYHLREAYLRLGVGTLLDALNVLGVIDAERLRRDVPNDAERQAVRRDPQAYGARVPASAEAGGA